MKGEGEKQEGIGGSDKQKREKKHRDGTKNIRNSSNDIGKEGWYGRMSKESRLRKRGTRKESGIRTTGGK